MINNRNIANISSISTPIEVITITSIVGPTKVALNLLI